MKKVLAISVIAVLCIASVFALDFNFGVKPVGEEVRLAFDVSTSISRLDVDFGVSAKRDAIGPGFKFENLDLDGYVLYNLIKSDEFKFGAGLFACGTDPEKVGVSVMAKASYKVAKMTSLFAYTRYPVATLDFNSGAEKVFSLDVTEFKPQNLIEDLTIGVTFSI